MRFSTVSLAVLASLASLTFASPMPDRPELSINTPAPFNRFDRVECRNSKQCDGDIPRHAKATCDRGTCSWTCRGDFTKSGNRCLETCRAKDCPDALNAQGICNSDAVTCGIKCNTGFTLNPLGTGCIPRVGGCGGQTCASLPFGTASCSKKNVCTYDCDSRAGYTLATASDGVPTCILRATRFDVNNCGAIGNVCGDDYTGRGSARCFNGSCTLRCPSGLSAFDGPPPFCG